MYKTRVLIISERKEQSIKYKKLILSQNQDVIITNSLSEALCTIQNKQIEFILISDTIKEKLAEFIRKIRVLTFNYRPIIIAISKSNDLDDKLKILEAGADDFISEAISKQEFQMRFYSHLRRYLESFVNPITHLSDKNITLKAIKKSLEDEAIAQIAPPNEKDNISYLLIKIKNLEIYRKTHGEIAYEKVLQTLSAIINSATSQEDYFGHINDDEILIITQTYQAEKMASFLTFAFDNILNKFYSNDEYQNNFTIQSSDEIEETKAGLMRLNIASVEKTPNQKDYRSVLNELNELLKLFKDENSSSYLIDRLKLNGATTNVDDAGVLILEPDFSLSYLLQNVCNLNDIKVKIAKDESEFKKLYSENSFKVVVLDWGKDGKESLQIAKEISKDDTKLIFSSSYLNKKEILKAGANLYIPKPYEIDDMIGWIKKFLQD